MRTAKQQQLYEVLQDLNIDKVEVAYDMQGERILHFTMGTDPTKGRFHAEGPGAAASGDGFQRMRPFNSGLEQLRNMAAAKNGTMLILGDNSRIEAVTPASNPQASGPRQWLEPTWSDIPNTKFRSGSFASGIEKLGPAIEASLQEALKLTLGNGQRDVGGKCVVHADSKVELKRKFEVLVEQASDHVFYRRGDGAGLRRDYEWEERQQEQVQMAPGM
jgi:hypothetical protein